MKIMNNLDTHVYCTDCVNFRLCDEGLPYCMYENKCNINGCEDSKPLNERPYYEEISKYELENKYQYAKRIMNVYLILEKRMLKNDFGIESNHIIESIEIAIEALEKQISKKPIENFYDEQNRKDWYSGIVVDEGYYYTCPSCGDIEVDRYSNQDEDWLFQQKRCMECGQLLDWR